MFRNSAAKQERGKKSCPKKGILKNQNISEKKEAGNKKRHRNNRKGSTRRIGFSHQNPEIEDKDKQQTTNKEKNQTERVRVP